MRNGTRLAAFLLLTANLSAQPLSPPASAGQPPPLSATSSQGQIVGTMSDLMVKIIYPASDAIFYITTRTPTSEAEWGELQGKALAVAESANLLMMPGRARDQDRWMADAKLMLDAGRAAFRAARAKDVAAVEAVNDQLYTSCTSCHQHYRPNYGRRAAPGGGAGESAQAVSAEKIDGRWRLLAAEDLRADGSVARYPWGQHPVGSIIVERGACYVQIMSSDTPSFAAATPTSEQMKAAMLSSYIAYSGPCTIDPAAGSVTLKVEAAWRPDYIGTEQKRFFRFENGKLLFGPAPNSMRAGTDTLTRRLTLERVP